MPTKACVSHHHTPFFSQNLRFSRGMTLPEMLIVLTIIAILLLLSLINVQKYRIKASDARRKSDLAAYKIGLEHYYDDNKCYPDPSLVATCGADTLQPYLAKILCDPTSLTAYTYVRDDCNTFRMYTVLKDVQDTDIAKIGCNNGCGPDTNGDGTADYNYGISSGNTNAGSPVGSAVPGTCSLAGGKSCYAGLCSVCCPGTTYRCNINGTLCNPDISCSQGGQ